MDRILLICSALLFSLGLTAQGIEIQTNFNVRVAKFIDERMDIPTLADTATLNAGFFPNWYITTVEDTGDRYRYHPTNGWYLFAEAGEAVDTTVIATHNYVLARIAELNDQDPDPENEIQVLSLVGDSLSLSNGGGTVVIPTYTAQTLSFNNGNYFLSLTGGGTVDLSVLFQTAATVSAAGGTTVQAEIDALKVRLVTQENKVDKVNDADSDPTNEFQTVSFDSITRILYLTDGGSAYIPAGAAGSGGGSGGDPTDELQTIFRDGSDIVMSKNGGAASIDDADADPTNENQTVSAGSGISVTQVGQDFVVSNDAPDRDIAIGAGANVNILGTYPNFTVEVPTLDDADASAINELQTFGFEGLIDPKVRLSINNSNFQLRAGANVSVTRQSGVGIIDIAVPTIEDADADPLNEIQLLSRQDDVITLSRDGGSFIDQDNQTAAEVASTGPSNVQTDLDNLDGRVTVVENRPDLVNDADSDPTNENQTVSAGTGIAVTQTGKDFQVRNTAPDLPVTVTGAGDLTVGGTYPNFTLTVPMDGDTSSGNELQIFGGEGTVDPKLTLSRDGGNFQFRGSKYIDVTRPSALGIADFNLDTTALDLRYQAAGGGGVFIDPADQGKLLYSNATGDTLVGTGVGIVEDATTTSLIIPQGSNKYFKISGTGNESDARFTFDPQTGGLMRVSAGALLLDASGSLQFESFQDMRFHADKGRKFIFESEYGYMPMVLDSYASGLRVGFNTTAPRADFDINHRGSMIVPSGLTNERQDTIVGMLRHSLDKGKFEVVEFSNQWATLATEEWVTTNNNVTENYFAIGGGSGTLKDGSFREVNGVPTMTKSRGLFFDLETATANNGFMRLRDSSPRDADFAPEIWALGWNNQPGFAIRAQAERDLVGDVPGILLTSYRNGTSGNFVNRDVLGVESRFDRLFTITAQGDVKMGQDMTFTNPHIAHRIGGEDAYVDGVEIAENLLPAAYIEFSPADTANNKGGNVKFIAPGNQTNTGMSSGDILFETAQVRNIGSKAGDITFRTGKSTSTGEAGDIVMEPGGRKSATGSGGQFLVQTLMGIDSGTEKQGASGDIVLRTREPDSGTGSRQGGGNLHFIGGHRKNDTNSQLKGKNGSVFFEMGMDSLQTTTEGTFEIAGYNDLNQRKPLLFISPTTSTTSGMLWNQGAVFENTPLGILVDRNNIAYDLHVGGTGAVKVSSGTTLQRPATGAQGLLRFTSDSLGFEGHDGIGWRQLAFKDEVAGNGLWTQTGPDAIKYTGSGGSVEIDQGSLPTLYMRNSGSSNTTLDIYSNADARTLYRTANGTLRGRIGMDVTRNELGMTHYNSGPIRLRTDGPINLESEPGVVNFSVTNTKITSKIDHVFDTKIGIGTTTPTAPLDVNGTARIRSLPTGTATGLVGHDVDGNLITTALSGNGGMSGTVSEGYLPKKSGDTLTNSKVYEINGQTEITDGLTVTGPSGAFPLIQKWKIPGDPSTFVSLSSNASNPSVFVPGFLGYTGAGNTALTFMGGSNIDNASNQAAIAFQARRTDASGQGGSRFDNRNIAAWTNYDKQMMLLRNNGSLILGQAGSSHAALDVTQYTSAIGFASGTTIERPTASFGFVRGNTDSLSLEFNDGLGWLTLATRDWVEDRPQWRLDNVNHTAEFGLGNRFNSTKQYTSLIVGQNNDLRGFVESSIIAGWGNMRSSTGASDAGYLFASNVVGQENLMEAPINDVENVNIIGSYNLTNVNIGLYMDVVGVYNLEQLKNGRDVDVTGFSNFVETERAESVLATGWSVGNGAKEANSMLAVGYYALGESSIVGDPQVDTTANNLVAIGERALYHATQRSNNIAIGNHALYYNTFKDVIGLGRYANATQDGEVVLLADTIGTRLTSGKVSFATDIQPTDGQGWVYSAAQGEFVPGTIGSGSGGVQGDTIFTDYGGKVADTDYAIDFDGSLNTNGSLTVNGASIFNAAATFGGPQGFVIAEDRPTLELQSAFPFSLRSSEAGRGYLEHYLGLNGEVEVISDNLKYQTFGNFVVSAYGAVTIGSTDPIAIGAGGDDNSIYVKRFEKVSARVGFNTSSPRADIDMALSGSLIVPSGITAQRDTAVEASLRHNTLKSKFEVVQSGTTWENLATESWVLAQGFGGGGSADGVMTGVSEVVAGNNKVFRFTRSNGLADIDMSINVDDGDSDDLNEIQSLSISGRTISASLGGGSVTVPAQTIGGVLPHQVTLSDGGGTKNLPLRWAASIPISANTSGVETINLNSVGDGTTNYVVLTNISAKTGTPTGNERIVISNRTTTSFDINYYGFSATATYDIGWVFISDTAQ